MSTSRYGWSTPHTLIRAMWRALPLPLPWRNLVRSRLLTDLVLRRFSLLPPGTAHEEQPNYFIRSTAANSLFSEQLIATLQRFGVKAEIFDAKQCINGPPRSSVGLPFVIYPFDLAYVANNVALQEFDGVDAIVCTRLSTIDRLREIGIPFERLYYVPTTGQGGLNNDYAIRFLMGIGAADYSVARQISETYFQIPEKDPIRIVLSLPETPERLARFTNASNRYFTMHGLRGPKAWQGCALSYKYLFNRLADNNVDYAIVCEDDAVISDDGENRLSSVLRYLDDRAGEWDVFSGYVSDLPTDAAILNYDLVDGQLFFSLTKTVSTVFNIYSRTAIRRLAMWDPSNVSETNTIDRYMSSLDLRFVSLLPFVASHDDTATSTLWGPEHRGYAQLAASSVKRLHRMLRSLGASI